MQTLTKVETWLPVFSGFYKTIWETDLDEASELDNINEQRMEKKLGPITWDDIEWDYEGYQRNVAESVTKWIGETLKKSGFISSYVFQELRSPREYNFTNDSIDVEFTLSAENRKAIRRYLVGNAEKFAEYISGRYTSRSGFFSSYSNDAYEWMNNLDATLEHKHKLGSILNFILENEDKDIEMTIYEDLQCNGIMLSAKNYGDLVEGK